MSARGLLKRALWIGAICVVLLVTVAFVLPHFSDADWLPDFVGWVAFGDMSDDHAELCHSAHAVADVRSQRLINVCGQSIPPLLPLRLS